LVSSLGFEYAVENKLIVGFGCEGKEGNSLSGSTFGWLRS